MPGREPGSYKTKDGRMSARHLIWAGLAAFAISVGGCKNNALPQPAAPPANPSPNPYSSATPVTRPPSDRPPDDDVRGTAEILAQKAATYAHTVEPLIGQRGTATTGPSVAGNSEVDHAVRTPATGPADSDSQAAGNQATSLRPETRPTARSGRPDSGSQVATVEGGGPLDATPATTDPIGRKLAQHAKDFPQDLAGQLDYQLYLMAQGQPVPQLPVLSGLSGEDRELTSALMDGLSNLRDAVRADGNLLTSRKVRPMLDMADRLRNQAELLIPTLALCRKVDGFGVYEPIEPARFIAGREQPVIVYCEVENFSSNLNDQKRWETKLAEEVVLYDEQNGLEVWRDKQTHAIVDYSRNRRHDFFIVKLIHLPANLTIGRFLLKVSVVDQQMQCVAENTAPMEIARAVNVGKSQPFHYPVFSVGLSLRGVLCDACLRCSCFWGPACAATHDIQISTHPADATVSVDGVARGTAPLKETFAFANDSDVHTVTATRWDTRISRFRSGGDFDRDTLRSN